MKKSNLLTINLCIVLTLIFSCSSDNGDSTSQNTITANNFTNSIEENPTNGTSLGMLNATINNDTTISYALNSQSVSGAIALSNTGELTVTDVSAFDYEINTEITATYTATSGDESATGDITITIGNIKDAPFMYKVKPVLFNGDYVMVINGASQIGTEVLTYNFMVDWGDGSAIETVTDISNVNHQYMDDNLYTISLFGDMPGIRIGSESLSLAREIIQWGEVEWKYLIGTFANNPDLQITATDTPDLSNVTALTQTFENCTNLNSGNFNDWDVSSITSLFETFKNCSKFNQDLNNWNTSNVTDLIGTFENTFDFNGNISNWDVSNVENMNNAFVGASRFNQDISGWKTENLIRMAAMFSGAKSFNQDISNWDVSKVTEMTLTFFNADSFNQDISGWDVGAVTDMSRMFENNDGFNQDISDWDVDAVISCSDFAKNIVFPSENLPSFNNCTP